MRRTFSTQQTVDLSDVQEKNVLFHFFAKRSYAPREPPVAIALESPGDKHYKYQHAAAAGDRFANERQMRTFAHFRYPDPAIMLIL
jgi:hypothetical protein